MNKDLFHLLVVDDDDRIRDLVKQYLEENNFLVTTASNAEDAKKKLEIIKFDLLILDIMMPGESGLSLTKNVKKNNNTPIILLTAKGETKDRIEGLELGADDYIAKPFSIREVILRVQAVLRRNHLPKDLSQVQGNWFKVHDVHIDIERRKVRCLSDDDSNPEVELTATEFDLLLMLAKSPGRVFSRNILMDQVWGQDYYGVDRTVDTHMSRLRRKLGTCGDHIQTVHGVGYRFKS